MKRKNEQRQSKCHPQNKFKMSTFKHAFGPTLASVQNIGMVVAKEGSNRTGRRMEEKDSLKKKPWSSAGQGKK